MPMDAFERWSVKHRLKSIPFHYAYCNSFITLLGRYFLRKSRFDVVTLDVLTLNKFTDKPENCQGKI